MADGSYEIIEVRFIIGRLTEMYVYINEINNCDGMLQGWHYKTFPAEESLYDIMKAWHDGKFEEPPLMWPKKSPPKY
jgi:hypothetical protein